MIIFGQHPVKDLLSDSSIRVKRVYVKNKNILDDLVKINKSIRNIDSIKISEKDFYDLTKSNSHQGLAVEIETPKLYEYTDFKKNIHELGRIIVVIDHVNDPHNLGAIIRSCVFFDINTVVIPKNRAASITPGSIKSSAGTIFKSTIYEVPNLKNVLIELKKKDYWVIGADIRGENINSAIFDQYMDEKIVLVLGSENKGISKILKKNCDLIARINNPGNTDSLNVSVASGIFLNRFS
ncbi:MAG: 23S rRNA (guanosine(2251)-2'-O)-methyltransferase RlmB [Thermodesulfobacteriota bacterium]|jgi:23S rRNA (guanosine2251-2'-O)-methyltransferase|tara:strand:- start:4947 stop:5660 length:714 start_codon:yes stop_codon:yes gene_type:complete